MESRKWSRRLVLETRRRCHGVMEVRLASASMELKCELE
jgi:hypothetical protein